MGTVVVIPAFTVKKTLSLCSNPWLLAVATVILFLSIDPLTVSSYDNFKLWCTPVPIPVKYTKLWFLIVVPIPTNTSSGSTPSPGVPKPILTVDNPIKSSLILATNNGVASGKLAENPFISAFARFVEIAIELPVFLWYVTLSPVLNLWLGRRMVLAGMNIWDKPPPGFEIETVVPIPTPSVSATPTDSTGLK